MEIRCQIIFINVASEKILELETSGTAMQRILQKITEECIAVLESV